MGLRGSETVALTLQHLYLGGNRVAELGEGLCDLPHLERLSALDARVHEGDLRDAAACRRALAAACAEADGAPLDVVHCGALISYRTRDAALQRAGNVDGTRHVLDACRAAR